MKIKKLHIKNFKSLTDVEINEPNPFTVFVGPNGSGKSNIFEALEFGNYIFKFELKEALEFFGGKKNILNLSSKEDDMDMEINYADFSVRFHIAFNDNSPPSWEMNNFGFKKSSPTQPDKHLSKKIGSNNYENEHDQFQQNFSRIFIGNENIKKQNTNSDFTLNIDASNLENVLKRLLVNINTKEDIIDWLQIFVPEFEKVEIQTSSLSGKNELAVYEKTLNQPLTKNLISDGTYNILALLTAIFQSDEPQFLCIEEPENGLNPFVIKKLVGLFREACETKGHYIWLNTHSQTLVNQLHPEELILVNKIDGATTVKHLIGTNLHGLNMDEAWLTNALGGGVPW